MNNKGKTIKFEKTLNNNQSTNKSYQRDKLKSKLIAKYNITSDEAEKIILKIEKKTMKHPKNKTSNTISKAEIIESNKSANSQQSYNHSRRKDNIKHEYDPKTKPSSKEKVVKQNIINSEETLKPKQNSQKVQNHEDVDSIIGNIIQDYNKEISIELDHVDLTFEVENEKVDTLKETFIRTLKRNNTKKFKIHALKDISFKIYKGEKVGIIGYNGAGKSTLLNVITGIYTPDKGKVTTNGSISPLLSLGAGFDHNFSGRKNILLNGAVLGYDKAFLESKMDEIIEFSELGDFIDIPIKNYSSGMMAKLGFSIATAVNPDILIIDEILGVGDVNFQKKSADKMKSLMDGGSTVLLVSHSIAQIRELCDKAIWMDNGHLRDMGEVNKICDKYLKDAENASNKQLANIELF